MILLLHHHSLQCLEIMIVQHLHPHHQGIMIAETGIDGVVEILEIMNPEIGILEMVDTMMKEGIEDTVMKEGIVDTVMKEGIADTEMTVDIGIEAVIKMEAHGIMIIEDSLLLRKNVLLN